MGQDKRMAEEYVRATQKALQSGEAPLVRRPKLTDNLLRKPPFRFLHDVISELQRNTGFAPGLFDDIESNSANVKDKESKVAYLEKIIGTVAEALGRPRAARPLKVVAGLEPENTNLFLQQLAEASQNGNGAEAVAKILGTGDDAAQDDDVPFPPQSANRGGISLDGRESISRGNADIVGGGGELDSPVSSGPPPLKFGRDADDELEGSPQLRHTGKFGGNTEPTIRKSPMQSAFLNEQQDHDPESPTVTRNMESTNVRRHHDFSNEEEDTASPFRGPPPPTHAAEPTPTSQQQQHDNLMQSGSNVRSSEMAYPPQQQQQQQDMSSAMASLDQRQQASPERAAAPPVPSRFIRPSSARRGPPRLKQSDGSGTRTQVGDDAGGSAAAAPPPRAKIIVDGGADDDDDDDDNVVVVLPESESGGFEAAAGDSNGATDENRGTAGKLVTNMLAEKDQLEEQARRVNEVGGVTGEGEAAEKPTGIVLRRRLSVTKVGEGGEKPQKRADLNELRESIQSLCQHTAPLTKTLDYIQEDVDNMNKEMQHWISETKLNGKLHGRNDASAQSYVGNGDRSQLNTALAELDMDIMLQKEKIHTAKAQVLRNEMRIQHLLQLVVNGS